MGRNTQISIEDEMEDNLAVYKVPYGAKLFVIMTKKLKKEKKYVNGILIHYQ